MSEQQIAFKAFAERKTREATTATIRTLTTVFDRSGATRALFIGNTWTRSRYGGDFGLVVTPAVQTCLSLVFVTSISRRCCSMCQTFRSFSLPENSVWSVMRPIRARPWVTTIPLDDRRLTGPIDQLRRDNRIQRISAVGGRSTATRLVDDGLAQDIYLTTGSREGGDRETPWYGGTASLALTVRTRKVWSEGDLQLVFEHILIA